MPQRRANGAPGGIDTRDQHQADIAANDRHGYRFTVNFGLEKKRDEVVARIVYASIDLVYKEVSDDGGIVLAHFFVLQADFEYSLDPCCEVVGHIWVDAQDKGNDARRDLPGVVASQIGATFFDELPDQLAA